MYGSPTPGLPEDTIQQGGVLGQLLAQAKHTGE